MTTISHDSIHGWGELRPAVHQPSWLDTVAIWAHLHCPKLNHQLRPRWNSFFTRWALTPSKLPQYPDTSVLCNFTDRAATERKPQASKYLLPHNLLQTKRNWGDRSYYIQRLFDRSTKFFYSISPSNIKDIEYNKFGFTWWTFSHWCSHRWAPYSLKR